MNRKEDLMEATFKSREELIKAKAKNKKDLIDLKLKHKKLRERNLSFKKEILVEKLKAKNEIAKQFASEKSKMRANAELIKLNRKNLNSDLRVSRNKIKLEKEKLNNEILISKNKLNVELKNLRKKHLDIKNKQKIELIKLKELNSERKAKLNNQKKENYNIILKQKNDQKKILNKKKIEFNEDKQVKTNENNERLLDLKRNISNKKSKLREEDLSMKKEIALKKIFIRKMKLDSKKEVSNYQSITLEENDSQKINASLFTERNKLHKEKKEAIKLIKDEAIVEKESFNTIKLKSENKSVILNVSKDASSDKEAMFAINDNEIGLSELSKTQMKKVEKANGLISRIEITSNKLSKAEVKNINQFRKLKKKNELVELMSFIKYMSFESDKEFISNDWKHQLDKILYSILDNNQVKWLGHYFALETSSGIKRIKCTTSNESGQNVVNINFNKKQKDFDKLIRQKLEKEAYIKIFENVAIKMNNEKLVVVTDLPFMR